MSAAIKIKQGDAFELPVAIFINGSRADIRDIEAVEFRVGGVRKLYPENVGYDADAGYFRVPLTQEETLEFPKDGYVQLDVRVKFAGGSVIGSQRVRVFVTLSALSEEVI